MVVTRVRGARESDRFEVLVNDSPAGAVSVAEALTTSQELFDGRQCDGTGGECRALIGSRLYPGRQWEQMLPYAGPVTYQVAVGDQISRAQF